MITSGNSFATSRVAPATDRPAAGAGSLPSTELRREFSSFAEWRAFVTANPIYLDPSFITRVAERIRRSGFYFSFSAEWITPGQVDFRGDNYRETIVFRGINSRNRAVIDELLRHLGDTAPELCRIYAPEALSQFAMLLRGRYPRFLGSEYSVDPKVRDDLYPIPVENILGSSLKSGGFDVAVVNDIFEHVPDLPTALREIARILRPGGRLISTFPFAFMSEEGIVKAKSGKDGIEYLCEPEYHGDPLSSAGALVFEIPGWNILNHCRSSGFQQAHMAYVLSERRGIIAPHVGGIFILVAAK